VRTLLILTAFLPVCAQRPPSKPDRPWHSPEERRVANEGRPFHQAPFRIESDSVYSLPELIDLAGVPQSRDSCGLGKHSRPGDGPGDRAQRAIFDLIRSGAFGVTPDADVVGRLSTGLPDVQRNLNWVHLATRFPVRVRVETPPPELFRVSESSVVVIRGH
jgi:hypothetical protein